MERDDIIRTIVNMEVTNFGLDVLTDPNLLSIESIIETMEGKDYVELREKTDVEILGIAKDVYYILFYQIERAKALALGALHGL